MGFIAPVPPNYPARRATATRLQAVGTPEDGTAAQKGPDVRLQLGCFQQSAIVLIGMPGAGKSTVGVLLAKHLGLGFVDTDILVQERAGRLLPEILDDTGYRELRRLEEEAILVLDARGAVIATGGSAVYSERAMRRLGESGVLVYLKASRDVLAARIDDYGRRGIANAADQSFAAIYRERTPLYERWADVVVEVDRLTHEGAALAVAAGVREACPGG